MLEIIRALRLGAINLFGIAIPGFLMVFFTFAGFLIPIITIVLHISKSDWSNILSLYEKNNFIVAIIVVLFSYVTGYILRLATPDDLDKVSARNVRIKLQSDDPEEVEWWPYTEDPKDKFPYYNFRTYLEKRGLNHLLQHVNWGHQDSNDKSTIKRSKTSVNIMKIDVALHSPELAAVVESNEAHVRLMSGTWISIKETLLLVWVGAFSTLLATVIVYFPFIRNHLGLSGFDLDSSPKYLVYFVAILFLVSAMYWAKYKIENLFHYRRVSELFHIVQAAHLAREIAQKDSIKIFVNGVGPS